MAEAISSYASTRMCSPSYLGGVRKGKIAREWNISSPQQAIGLLSKRDQRNREQGSLVGCACASFKEDGSERKIWRFSFTDGDWRYMKKFSGGCVAGAVVIKYGSILVPGITQPNVYQALVMIFSPVVLSMLALTVASLKQSDQ